MRTYIGRAKTAIATLRATRDGLRFARDLPAPSNPAASDPTDPSNPLDEYFDSVTEGPGIWKWRHYFPIYHRHLAKFVGHKVHVAEIGIYSGGSLPMWRSYFGEGSHVYGIDIAPECRAHEQDGITVFIGDQADQSFWDEFRRQVPRIDVVIDDGGHEAHQQITSLRCLLPHMAMGGVYICEDVLGAGHQFHSFAGGLSRGMSDLELVNVANRMHTADPLPVHQHVASVHHYPLLTVFEKPDGPIGPFDSARRGTQWEPSIRL
jgi:hypothetical protein